MLGSKKPNAASGEPTFITGGPTLAEPDERPRASSVLPGSVFRDSAGISWKANNTPLRSTWKRVWLQSERAMRLGRRIGLFVASCAVILLLASLVAGWFLVYVAIPEPKPHYPSLETISFWLKWLLPATTFFAMQSAMWGAVMSLNAANPKNL